MNTNRPGKNTVSQTGRFFIGLSILLLAALMIAPKALAADYPRPANRSLTIESTIPGVVTNYTMSWQLPTAATIGSIRLQLCDSAFIDEPCVNPNGDMTAATLTAQSGVTGFSVLSQNDGEVLLTRAPAVAATTPSSYTLSGISNPSGLQDQFFMRIFMYPTADGSGAFNHAGSIASATAEPIVINTEVPPILFFCAALTIDDWCQNVNGNFIDYGELSPVTGDAAVSQFGAATNAQGGYVVTINGNTLTAGNRTITALSAPAAYTPGSAQFGLNLRANTNPALGQDPSGAGTATVAGDYNNPDLFKFANGDAVATAVSGTLFNTFTVTYIVNIPPDQASGVYNTTIAYICTAAF